MNTSKVSRLEIIDHTLPLEKGGGRAYVKRDENVEIELSVQDEGRTLKVFIRRK